MGSKLGARVRECRLKLGITQQELADGVKLTAAYISQIESGKRTNIGKNNLERIAEALDTTAEHLLTGVKMSPQIHRPVISAEEMALLDLYRSLDPLDRDSAKKLISWLIFEKEKKT